MTGGIFELMGSTISAGAPQRPRIFDAFQRSRDFRYLWVSNLLYFGGNWTQVLMLGWIAYELTSSAFLLALFTTVRLLPMLLGPFGGTLADRVDRVRLLLVLMAVNVAITAVLVVLLALDILQFWHLLLGGLLLGLTQGPAQPARLTLVMDTVGRENVSNAMSLNNMAMGVPRVVGPAIGGLLLGWLGPVLSLSISAIWFGIAGLTLLPIRALGRTVRTAGAENWVRQLVDGFRIVLSHKGMAAVLAVSLSANMFIWPAYQAFMPVFAKDIFHVDEFGLGLLLTAVGIGNMIGALGIASLGDYRHKGKLFIVGTAFFGLFFGLFAIAPSFPLALLFLVIGGVASAAFGIMQSTLMLIQAPEEVRGRAMGVQMLAIGVLPVATLVQGAIADQVGVVAMAVAAGAMLVLVMLAIFILNPTLRRLS